MPNEPPFDPRTILDAAAGMDTGLTIHFKSAEERRAFQILLSATRRAEQKRLALSVRKWDDLLALTGWENIVTRSLDGCKLWVGIQTRDCFGIGRINGLNGDTG